MTCTAPQYIISVIRWARHVAGKTGTINTHIHIYIYIHTGQGQLRRSKDNIKMDHKDRGRNDKECIHEAHDRDRLL